MVTKTTGYIRRLCFIDDIYFCGMVKVVHVFTDFAVLTAMSPIYMYHCVPARMLRILYIKKHYQATVVFV